MMPKFTLPVNLLYEKAFTRNDSDVMYLYAEGTYLLKSCYRYILQRRGLSRRIFRYGVLMLILLLFSLLLKANTFPVTNTYDSGPGSLRQAIIDANAAGAGPHSIVFNVYGQITILSSLPTITKSNVTIDGQNKITINSNGTNQIINPFIINANNVTIRNIMLMNSGDLDFYLLPNTNGVLIENISASSNTGSWLNSFLYVNGASTNLTVRNVNCTDVEYDQGGYPYSVGRAIVFVGGLQTNLVMDNINLLSLNASKGGEAVIFRDASVNGWTFTNSNISAFKNAIVLDNTGGPIETANNVLLRNIIVDSLVSGVALGFYSDFVNTNIQIKSSVFDLDVTTGTNDGDYGVRFDNTTNGVTLDTVTVKDGDLYSVWFNGAAQNVTINHTKISDPTPGDGYNGQFLRFEGTANTVTIKNTILDADKLNATDDADYGLLFIGATNGVTLDSLTVNEFDVDGVYIAGANTNFQLSNSKFTKNLDGIEFYNAVPRTNVDIINSSFSGQTRSGIVVNAGNATSDIDLTGDTVYNNTNHGIWLYGGTPATDMTISGCVIHDNGGAGINNDDPDKVIYTNNSIYNNKGLGIDNVAGNCGYQGVNRPVLVSSTSLGGGQYSLVINLPALVPTGYTVDIYANDPATSASSGQYFVTSLTGLNSGNNTSSFTYNTGPGATGVGFWTATLRIPANNCGTSEFSDKLNIGIKAPACVTPGILAWYRADMGVNGMIWGDISGNGNNMTVIGDPDDTTGLVNFNKAFYYDGNDAHRVPATAGVTTAYTMMGLGKLEGTQNSRVFSSYTGNKLLGWWGGAENGYYNEAWLKSTTAITNLTKLYSIKRANTGSGPYEFKGNGALLSSGAASNASVWTLDVGSSAFNEYSKVFVPEVFIYNRDLTPTEIQRLESYMALKYGITLNNGATDYVASDGTTLMWSSSANSGYVKRITGIGRDDCTILHQKQSLSADTGLVTIALGNMVTVSNAANANAVTNDKTFLVFGDNNGSVAYATAVTGTNVTMRMGRVFKVQKSAAWGDQNITLKIKGAGANNYLLISNDPTFATITQELQLDANGSVTLNSSLLANGAYFTIGAAIKGPGNVTAGVALWLRADDGNANGTQWNDFSGNGNGSTQPVTASQASVLPAGINFNPALKFDGSNDFLRSPSLFTSTGVNNLQVYAVTVTDVVQAQSIFGELVSNGQQVLAHVPWSDGVLYFDAPYGYRAQGAWGGTLGAPYLWSFVKSLSTMSANRNRITVSSYTAAMGNIAGSNSPFNVGANNVGYYFNGKIAEMIVYNNSAATSATQRQQIESYLALKYGLTLSPASPVDYLASDGTTKFWDAAANTAYRYHITGIGRDSVTALNQKQSLSVDTGYVTVALGTTIAATNAANTGIITNNKSFFVFSDNGGAKAYTNTITGLTNVNVTLGRVFKVQKTNWSDQDITLATDTTLPAPDYLVISTDAVFGTGDVVLPVTNRKITLNTSQLANGVYFTFGNVLKAPGNVTAGIAAWWRADVDASATTWNDYSGNGKTLAQTVATAQPALLPVNINYQPAVKFHNRAYYTSASLFGTASTNNIAIFSVSAADGAGGNSVGSGLFSEYVSNGDRIAAWAPHGNAYVYFYAPAGWYVQSATELIYWAIPRYNILGFTKTPSQLNILFNNTTVGTANGTYTGINGNNQPFFLGAYNGPDWFNGRIAEFVVYNNSSAMTVTDRLRIQSYLALKYGITLSPATPGDYLASDGTTKMWTAADNTGYGRRITGLGRDDSSALYQKQSISVDTGMVAIAAGSAVAASNAGNATTIPNNKSFFVFSDNGAATGYLTAVSGINGVNNRMTRIFKVDKTNWADQDITLKLNGGNARTYLLVSADAIFGAGDAAYVLNADSTVTLNSSNLPDGAFFTFATGLRGPNNINNGIMVWLRADDGSANGTNWNDFSRFGAGATQPATVNQPATDAKGINFNYAFKFDGVDDFMDNATDTLLKSNNATLIAVVDQLAYTTWGGVFSYNRSGNAERPIITVTDVNNKIGANHVNVNATQASVNTPAPAFLIRTRFTASDVSATANGGTLTNTISPSWVGTGTTPGYHVGRHNTANYYNGYISEVIAYNRPLGAAELQQVESYLALKYGLTLNNGATAYLASDASTYWTVDATYNRRVTGIGRDDSTALNTKQSLNVDTGLVTLALGGSIAITNEQNSSAITNNKSFFVFADNGLSAGNFTVVVTGSAHNVTRRMARVWKVQKTNWADQNITLKIKPIGIDNYMFISSDPNFATFTQELPVAADGTITLSSSLFTASDVYFTFGAPLKSPGGISGHNLWVRADIGTSSSVNNTAVNEWSDMSALANTATQPAVANQPLFMNNIVDNVNFNSMLKFNGTSHRMLIDGTKLPLGTSARTVISVTANASVVNRSVISWGSAVAGSNGTRYTMEIGAGQRYIESSNSRYGNTGGNTIVPSVTTFINAANTTPSATQMWVNNAAVTNAFSCCGNFTLNTTSATLAYLGENVVNGAGGLYYSGLLGETIVYDKALTATEQQRVESYLALKYGITLNSGNTSYLATDGSTVVWDATANSAYKNNIAGIGRDDEEALQQRQSRSINTGTQITIGLGNIDSVNTSNTNNFSIDKSYLVWGDDGGSLSFRTAVTGGAIANYRMARVWKVQETGTVGTVQIAIPANAVANLNKSYFILSNDNVFNNTDAFTLLTPVTINGTSYLSVTADLANGQYFTFASDLKFPGGVVGNSLWLRPDYGTSSTTDNSTVNEWDDFGADINHATQATAANQPLFMNNISDNINFNPVMKFNGSNQFMDLDITKLPMGTSGRTQIAIGKPVSIAGTNKYIVSWGQSVAGQGSALGSYTTSAGVFVGYGDDVVTAVNFWQPGRPNVLVNVWAGTGGSVTLYSKGLQVGGPVNKNWNTTGTVARIGNSSFAATQPEYWNGTTGDIIVYPFALNAGQRLKVESYLAVKYGYTIDQATANNYLSADSSVIWNATANATYKFGITGIGRDDLEGLNQKQSRNNDTTRLRIAIGLGAIAETNADNANSFAADKSYLIWGDDNAAISFKTTVTGNPNVNYRMTRLWTVQETGTIGQVEVAFPFDVLPNPRQSYLVVSADATIDNSDTYIPLYDVTINGKKHWAAKTDFATGQYFTIAAFVKSPGAVGATSLWVRADQGIINNTDGSAVDVWVDYGNEVNTATQTTVANQPVFMNNATDNINYNPVVKFNGSSHLLNLDITKLPMGTTPRTLIGVAKSNNITGGRYIIAYGNSVPNQGMGLSNNGGTGYWIGYSNDISVSGFWQQNVPNELFGTWAGNGGAANLYSKMTPVATTSNRAWNTAGTVARIGNSPWASEYWSGPISEIIAFDRELNNNERQRVSTYLAIRNGYTMNQATPYSDYLNTNSTVIWNAAASTGHNINIAGIGRDDIEGLNQKQSKSVQAGAIVAIGLGGIATDNASNTATFVNDTSYMIWGSNSNALATTTTDLPARFTRRLTQEWEVSLSNFDNQLQPVAMVFNLTGITYTAADASDFNLLIDTDGDANFTTGTIQSIPATGFNSGDNTVSFDNITTLTSNAVFTLAIGPQAVKLTTKVILQGAWNGTAMTTALKTAAVLPAADPYGQSTTPSVSPNATAAQVVDWVLVELRDATNPATVIASRAGFVLANGNIVDTNYTQPLGFTGIDNGLYKVAIRHRNHLGVMTLNDVDFSSGAATVDFTSPATVTWGTNAQKSLTGGVMGMWAGDVNDDHSIRHSSKPSDASEIANAVLTHAGNTTASPTYTGFSNVYSIWDVNLDGRVYYSATPSDHTIITNNVKTHPANTFGLTSFIITQQLP